MTTSLFPEHSALPRSANPAGSQISAWRRLRTAVVAALAAISIVAASSAPAHADRKRDHVLAALAAIAAIAIIGEAVKDKKDPHRRPVRGPRVPSVCAIEIGAGRGSVVGYGARCLQEENFGYRLPRDCATNIRIYGRLDKFYPAECLHKAGFDVRPR